MNPKAASPTLVTFVIAVHNGQRTIARCLESIWGQTDTDREIIIVDAASTDGTVDYLRKNASRITFWSSEPDTGVYQAWNKALAKANGEWIVFLGADDRLFSEDVLARVRSALSVRKPNEILFYGRLVNVNSSGEVIETLGRPWEEIRDLYPKMHCLPHAGAFHHRSMFDAGGFDEEFRIAGDYDLLLRELRTRQAHFIPEVTVVAMEIGGMSSNPANSLINLRENRKAQKKWGVAGFLPSFPLAIACIRVLIRWGLLRLFGADRVATLLDYGRSLMGKEPYWSRLR